MGNPYVLMNVWGVVMRAPYLPYVFLGFNFISNGRVLEDLIGIVVGHVYYFLEDVFPRQEGGFKIIITPDFLKKILNENYVVPGPDWERVPLRGETPNQNG